MRPLSPYPDRSFTRLDGYPVLLVSGEADARRDPRDGASLAKQLTTAGATTTLVVLPVGHVLTTADENAVLPGHGTCPAATPRSRFTWAGPLSDRGPVLDPSPGVRGSALRRSMTCHQFAGCTNSAAGRLSHWVRRMVSSMSAIRAVRRLVSRLGVHPT